MNHTQNLNLPQWEASDFIQRTDFNDAFQKLDAVPRIVTGTYTGTGTYGSSHPNTLSFDFAPKFVLIRITGLSFYYGLALFSPLTNGSPDLAGNSYSGEERVFASWNGNSVSWYNEDRAKKQLNEEGRTYCYLAIG